MGTEGRGGGTDRGQRWQGRGVAGAEGLEGRGGCDEVCGEGEAEGERGGAERGEAEAGGAGEEKAEVVGAGGGEVVDT